MGPRQTPEWLPEGATNNGLVPAAAQPPPSEDTRSVPEAESRAQPSVALDRIERLVGERIAEIERRIESKLAAAVEDLQRAVDRRAEPPPHPHPSAPRTESPPSPLAEPPEKRHYLPAAPRDGDGDRPAIGAEADSRLREAERRVAQAARATDRNVDEVRRLLGARLAATGSISDRDDGRGARGHRSAGGRP